MEWYVKEMSLLDTLDDSSTLPELSFDDLLDSSPVKKNGSLSAAHDDDDLLETDTEARTPSKKDDILNTPGSKKFQFTLQRGRPTMPITHNSISTKPTPMRATTINPGNPVNAANTAGHRPPILLNTKNVLPKTASQTTNHTIKVAPKAVSSDGGNGVTIGGGGGSVTGTSSVSLAGKTAVRTSTGQLIYIQKTSSATPSSATTVKTTHGTTFAVKTAATKPTSNAAGTGNKSVTIQFRRAANGSFVPVNANTIGTANKTLTLSPTSTLAGKKLITSTGGQVVIKSTTSSGVSTNSTATSLVKPTTIETTTPKSKTILVHSSAGKPIMLSNSNLVKIAPQTQPGSSGNITGTTSTVVNTGQGQVHSLQIPGKPGMQYVRVMPQAKVNVSSLLSSTSATPNKITAATSATSVATTTTTSSASSIQAPVKILNQLPQKFTVLQKGTATKVVVTQKKDMATGDYAPVASKVQTSIVAVSANKPIIEDKNKTLTSQQSTENQNQTLVRKHKISELNSELKRITTTETDDNGPPEVKKSVPNSRLVVISSSNAPKLLNNSLLQPGRVTTVNTSVAKQVQGTILQPTSHTYTSTASTTTTASGQAKHLYTILKPSTTQTQQQQNQSKVFSGFTTQSQQQQNQSKVFSGVKPNGNAMVTPRASTAPTLQSSTTASESKIPTNKQTLVERQQKIFELKQLLKSKSYTASSSLCTPTTTIATASTFLPIKIKEEPAEFLSESAATPSLPTEAVLDGGDVNQIDLVGGAVRRKHCNCSKSLCLKLYCDCFANGEFCQDCTCKDCFNNLENEDERQKAIKICLERNPSAFKPKITSSSDQGDMRLHNKGCNCKRSGCLKNYCECYEAKIPCSSNCRCVGCRNFEDRADLDMDPIEPKLSSSLGNAPISAAGHKRTYTNVAIKTEKCSTDVIKIESGVSAPPIEKQQQCNFITQEVVDATIQCMITQADECEKNGVPHYQTEKMVMEELGRCLVEIIDFSIRNTDTSYSQD